MDFLKKQLTTFTFSRPKHLNLVEHAHEKEMCSLLRLVEPALTFVYMFQGCDFKLIVFSLIENRVTDAEDKAMSQTD